MCSPRGERCIDDAGVRLFYVLDSERGTIVNAAVLRTPSLPLSPAPEASPVSSQPEKPGRTERSHEEYEIRLVDGLPQLVKVEEGFVIPGRPTEAGGSGFAHFKERVMHMLKVLQESSGVLIVGMRCERQEPRPPYAKVTVRLPEYDLPKP